MDMPMSGVDCPKCIVVTFGAGRMVFGLLRKLLAMGGSEAIGLKQRYHYVYRMPISVCLWGIQALTLLSRSGVKSRCRGAAGHAVTPPKQVEGWHR